MLWSLSFWFLILPLIFDARHNRLHLFTFRPRPIQYDTVFVARMLLIPVGNLPVYLMPYVFVCDSSPVLKALQRLVLKVVV